MVFDTGLVDATSFGSPTRSASRVYWIGTAYASGVMVNWSHWLDPPEGSEPPSRLILATAPVSAVWMRMRKDLVETRVERPLSLMRASRQCDDSTSNGITSFTSSNWRAMDELAVNCGIYKSSCANNCADRDFMFGTGAFSSQHSAKEILKRWPNNRLKPAELVPCWLL